MFQTVSFKIAKIWKKGINKRWQTVEYYSVCYNKEIKLYRLWQMSQFMVIMPNTEVRK